METTAISPLIPYVVDCENCKEINLINPVRDPGPQVCRACKHLLPLRDIAFEATTQEMPPMVNKGGAKTTKRRKRQIAKEHNRQNIRERERINDPELAQWYLESGSDDKWCLGMMLAISIGAPPLAIIALPIGIYLFVHGCRKRGKGKRMNKAAGRENFERCPNKPSRFAPHTPMKHERYGSVSGRPPGHPDYYEIPTGGTAPVPKEYALAPSTAEANARERVYHTGTYEVSVPSNWDS